MGVERVYYYDEDEYQQELQDQQQEKSQEQEPDVVPCFKCGGQMYEEANEPKGNICPNCSRKMG